MRIYTFLTVFLFAAFGLFACNTSSEEVTAQENVTISISSSNPDSTILFEAINIGEWRGSAPADSQSTPFEFVVNGDNFFGTFHKLDGNSQMVIKLVGKKNEEITWETEKEFDRLSQVILDENFTSIDGK